MSSTDDCFPGYQLGDELARTLLSVVYEAEEEHTGRRVAVKNIKDDLHGRREIDLHNRIEQANPGGPVHVMRLLETYAQDGSLWLALEYFDSTLECIDCRRLTPLALMNIAVDSAKGLVEMYRAGVIDDDVKPANIAFKAHSGRAAHLDLGCARLSGQMPVGGTPEYCAPELLRRQPSDTSPCYGWALSMEHIVVGGGYSGGRFLLNEAVPWVGEAFARLIHECRRDDPDRRPSVPALYGEMKRIVQARRRCAYCNAVAFGDGVCVHCGR